MLNNMGDLIVQNKEKGIKSKGSGRKKGTPNVVTSALRGRMIDLLDIVEKQIVTKKDLDNLNSKDRLDVYFKLMSYLCPKPIEKPDSSDGDELQKEIAVVMQAVMKMKK
jgi:hypothetical protein